MEIVIKQPTRFGDPVLEDKEKFYQQLSSRKARTRREDVYERFFLFAHLPIARPFLFEDQRALQLAVNLCSEMQGCLYEGSFCINCLNLLNSNESPEIIVRDFAPNEHRRCRLLRLSKEAFERLEVSSLKRKR